MAMRVRLVIDSIVVEGMDARQVARFERALHAELSRRAAETPADTISAPGPISVPLGNRPEDTAAGIAGKIFGGSK